MLDLLTNPVLISAVFAWLLAQFLKIFTSAKYRDGMSFLRFLFGSGGMPSSHSAAVCATCFSCGILYGFDSALFAVSGVLAVVVMRDAAGIRREAGKQAQVINQISEELNKKKKKPTFEESLKVFLGHTPLQVLFGAMLGIMMAFFCQFWLFPRIFPV
ncbi:MAG: divergent PAP2 family protein [Clostridia bacterium]|nr:divergent PAP2 family protein [Clostridia bacterium]